LGRLIHIHPSIDNLECLFNWFSPIYFRHFPVESLPRTKRSVSLGRKCRKLSRLRGK